MWSSDLIRLSATVIGDRGELGVLDPFAPFRRLSVRSADGKRVERFPPRTIHSYQLDAFAAAVLRGEPVKTTPEDAIENMNRRCDLSCRRPPAPSAGLNANPVRPVGSSDNKWQPRRHIEADAMPRRHFHRLSRGEMHLVHVRGDPQGVGRDR
jgi:hypothetical protein